MDTHASAANVELEQQSSENPSHRSLLSSHNEPVETLSQDCKNPDPLIPSNNRDQLIGLESIKETLLAGPLPKSKNLLKKEARFLKNIEQFKQKRQLEKVNRKGKIFWLDITVF